MPDITNEHKTPAGKNAGSSSEQKKTEELFFLPRETKNGFFSPKPSVFPVGHLLNTNSVIQKKENPFPEDVQDKMESAFDQDFSGVKIHTASQQATELNALAYTQGEEIHFAPGQFDPASLKGKELIGHELAHVVQQRQGIVQPTIQAKGSLINDDKKLEQEADDMGRKAARAENNLHKSPSLGIRSNLRTAQLAKKGVVQRAPVPTHYGQFKDKTYSDVGTHGVSIELEFHPGNNVDAKKIGLTQVVRSILGGANTPVTPTQDLRMTSSGRYIDRIATRNNPIYGGQQLGAADGLEKTNPAGGNYRLGWNYTDATGPHKKEAYLSDTPTRPGSGKNTEQIFETTALALEGTQVGLYYGSVQWGYQVDGSGTFRRLPLTIVSEGAPSALFFEAARKWNAATSQGTIKTRTSPTQVFDNSYAVAFTVPVNTTVSMVDLGIYTNNNIGYNSVTIVDGTHAGQAGKIKIADMRDQADGAATTNLPIEDVFVISKAAGAVLNAGLPGPWRYTNNLPANTRLKILDASHVMGPFQTNSPFDYKAYVEVVQGLHTGKIGWLDFNDLRQE